MKKSQFARMKCRWRERRGRVRREDDARWRSRVTAAVPLPFYLSDLVAETAFLFN